MGWDWLNPKCEFHPDTRLKHDNENRRYVCPTDECPGDTFDEDEEDD